MRTATDLPLQLDPTDHQPVFLQISRAISDDIRRGRLRPGVALPGSRALAASLGCHRNTVLAAFRELEAEGWITASPAKGTFVSRELPFRPARRFDSRAPVRAGIPELPGFALGAARHPGTWPTLFPPGVLMMGGGAPDVRLAPVEELVRAYRRAVGRSRAAVMGYADPAGHPRLRDALARHLSRSRGLAATPQNVLVTRGSQMALDLLARELVRPGDVVAVEALGYRPAWEALRLAGAELVPVRVDDGGLVVAEVEALANRRPLRAVYVTPHHQYPSTRVLSAARRLALLELARRRRFAILEDDYDHEFHFEGRPVLPLASADPHGVVVYIGTFSKLFAPGLRIGFLVGPATLVQRLASLRAYVDRQGDHALELALSELIDDGAMDRHARKVCRAYQARRDALVEAVGMELGGALSFQVPRGGMALWARAEEGLDVDAWATEALRRKVGIHPGSRFTFDGAPVPFLRLGYGAPDEKQLRAGVRVLKAALESLPRRRRFRSG
ncbi:MAG: PLP-dependent aminotransferase family protein [Myxococcota bacterium]|nr:PLP-dependent aminotransferase family protein [Myxococcota bacterium]